MSTPPVMSIVSPYTPELLPQARDKIENYLSGYIQPSVLEFGSGWSTVWFATQDARVLSFEHDWAWWYEVCRVLRKEEIDYKALPMLLGPGLFDLVTLGFPDEKFRLVYVDCIDEKRVGCTLASLAKIRPGGLLVLDDTHWPLWEGVGNRIIENGFGVWDTFEGDHLRKDGTTHFHKTTIYQKGSK